MIQTRPLLRVMKPGAWEKTFKLTDKSLPTQYLSMKSFLIQGARPKDKNLITLQGFQMGYRCVLKLITTAAIGSVVIADDKLGFEYTPVKAGWTGHDSFSYSLVGPTGYESDAQCIHVYIG